MKMKIVLGVILIFVLVGGVFAWRWNADKKSSQNVRETGDTQASIVNSASTTFANEPVVDNFVNDQDFDGILDEKEKELGLSNKTSDTDKDGLTDFTEIEQYKTDPKNKDTDGDGYVDGYEVLNGFDPKGSGKLNP